ncbi:MAG: hypothetical protein Q4F98_03855 [Lachnospiraceae bacterium]|nr:hypothetical protein [Lachnospiraceae bacterium]
MEISNIILCFFIYGFLGWCTEVAYAAFKEHKFVNRGFLNSAICPIYGFGVVIVVQLLDPYAHQIVLLYLLSVVLTTVLEWLTGFALDKLFHHKWWDYSDVPFNLNGYVCVPFSAIWGLACVFVVKIVHPLILKLVLLAPKWLVLGENIVFTIAIFIDLYVTVSAILKLNRRLEKMEEVAAEFHRISDQIGNDIYKNVMEGMERQERIKEQTEVRKEELRAIYEELQKRNPRVTTRLMRAFPKMQPRRHEEQFHKLREFRRSEWYALKARKKERKEAKKNKK